MIVSLSQTQPKSTSVRSNLTQSYETTKPRHVYQNHTMLYVDWQTISEQEIRPDLPKILYTDINRYRKGVFFSFTINSACHCASF